MADIELVIKISQESYNNLKIGCTQRVSDSEMIEALKNGTPLPKKLLERAITCFKMEHPAEFEQLLNGDEGMKQKIVEGNKSFHCGIEESGFHAYNCNDCPNKCEEYYQWDKEMRDNEEKREKK